MELRHITNRLWTQLVGLASALRFTLYFKWVLSSSWTYTEFQDFWYADFAPKHSTTMIMLEIRTKVSLEQMKLNLVVQSILKSKTSLIPLNINLGRNHIFNWLPVYDLRHSQLSRNIFIVFQLELNCNSKL